jgi:putative membrane protein
MLTTNENPQNRWEHAVKAVVLLGLAVYFAYTIASGNLNYYINLRFAWLSYVAVIILALLGLSSFGQAVQQARRSMGGHPDRRVSAAMLLMVSLPLGVGAATILTGNAKPLGVEAVGSIRLNSDFGGAGRLADKAPLDRDILDWSRAFSKEQAASTFNGQEARLLGFVYTEPGFPEGRFMVARFTLSCCVADSQAIGLPAAYDGLDQLKPGDWVIAEGTFRAETFMEQTVPVLQVASLTPTEQPEQPYLYP